MGSVMQNLYHAMSLVPAIQRFSATNMLYLNFNFSIMKAVFVGPKFGNSAVRIEETGITDPGREDVLVKVVAAGLNPLDYNLINGNIVYNLKPVPHIPGSEVIGIVERDSRSFKKGQRVMVYNRVFDGTCEMCRTHREHLCTNGGIWGVVTNGGYSEYVTVPEKNAMAIPDSIDNDTAVSIPIGALTAYRALKRAGAAAGKKLLVYGASGNTGIFAIQFASIMGLDVYGVSRKEWVREYGCTEVFGDGKIPDQFRADIVMNSLGSLFWDDAVKHIQTGGTLVSFGVLTGREAKLDIASLYTREVSIIGSTGGDLKDLTETLEIMKTHRVRVPVAKRFNFNDIGAALEEYSRIRDGRIIIDFA